MKTISEAAMNEMLVALGSAIRELRQERGLTLEELASRVELHVSYISLVERGRRNPTWRTVRRISKAMDIPFLQLVSRAEEMQQGL